MTDSYDAAITYAADLGAEHGRNAAEWYLQDVFQPVHADAMPAQARRILRGIDDGDPAIQDTFPFPDLSGQWADSLTGPQLVADALTAAGLVHDGDAYSRPYGHAPGACPVCDSWDAPGDIADAYETAFRDAVESAIADACRAVLS